MSKPITKFADIPQFTRNATYKVDLGWNHFPEAFKEYVKEGLNIDPDYQRGHVWTEKQQIAKLPDIMKG